MALRVGVIGTGAIGQDHIRRIHTVLTGAEIAAVTDVDAERARQAISNQKLHAKLYADGHELIESADVDAVMITSWGPTHEEFVLASIAAGKPVFCEKPLAVTAEGCRRIVHAEMAFGRPLVQVGYMRRYDRGYRELKRVMDSGTIGEPLLVHCAHRNQSQPDSYTNDMAIVDTFIHEIDVLRWLLNDDYVSVQVVKSKRTKFAAPHLQDPLIVILETEKGTRVIGEVFVNCQYGYDIQCQVVGESGVANLPEPQGVVIRSDAKLSTKLLTDWKQRFADAYDLELQDWIRSALRGEVHGPTAWDGYAAAVTSDHCLEARDTGGIVRISLPQRPSFYHNENHKEA